MKQKKVSRVKGEENYLPSNLVQIQREILTSKPVPNFLIHITTYLHDCIAVAFWKRSIIFSLPAFMLCEKKLMNTSFSRIQYIPPFFVYPLCNETKKEKDAFRRRK